MKRQLGFIDISMPLHIFGDLSSPSPPQDWNPVFLASYNVSCTAYTPTMNEWTRLLVCWRSVAWWTACRGFWVSCPIIHHQRPRVVWDKWTQFDMIYFGHKVSSRTEALKIVDFYVRRISVKVARFQYGGHGRGGQWCQWLGLECYLSADLFRGDYSQRMSICDSPLVSVIGLL